MKLRSAVFCFGIFCSGLTQAQGTPFVVASTHIDQVRSPKNVFDKIRECSNNNLCSNMLKAVEIYYQIPPGSTATVAAKFSGATRGEGWGADMILPNGYLYCGSSMKMISIVPHDGPRGSLFRGAVARNGIHLETWTPIRPPGAGRSWVEADVTLIGVREDLAAQAQKKGQCKSFNERNIWYCRGGGCVNTVDVGQSVSSASPPGANSRK